MYLNSFISLDLFSLCVDDLDFYNYITRIDSCYVCLKIASLTHCKWNSIYLIILNCFSSLYFSVFCWFFSLRNEYMHFLSVKS